MRTSTCVYLNLTLIAIALWIPQPAHSSGIDPGLAFYTSSLRGSGSQHMAFSIRGNLGNIDDIAASFLDADDDKLVDGFVIDTLEQGVPQGSQTHTFAGTEAGGVEFLAFPIVTSNSFGLTAATFLPGVPATALPLVPITDQGTIVVTRANGEPLLSFPLMIDPELLSDTLFDSGFESPPPPAVQ